MDQQAPVPPVAVPPGDREAVPVAPVPPIVEVPFATPVPPPPPVLIAEELVMQVEKFLRLQPPTYSRGPNPDAVENWVHEIERVFATMRCPAADKVVLDNNVMVEYFIRGLRVELQDAIVPLMCKTVEEAAQRAATLERSIRTRQVGESGSGSFRLPQQSVGASKGKEPAGPSSSGFGKWGQKLKQAFKGRGRGWGGRPQFQQGRGRPEVEESQQSTARQPIVPRGYRCYNCNHPGHLIRNCPYLREYGYGRGVQQQQQPQQFQQPQSGRGIGVPQQRGRGRVMAITRAQAEASNMIEGKVQVLKGAWRIVERVALPNYARKRRGMVQFPWELAEGLV
ncbi:hypothetical protein Taro_011641 [Colocasia esculenta]|uniref:CCHC-type domain-containing protein n=1 Tax=Colocasia esculenta TaxID=4460 RepID=A0A843UD92_COLES|nr:hypothetical protein [Colocasia esculenta]